MADPKEPGHLTLRKEEAGSGILDKRLEETSPPLLNKGVVNKPVPGILTVPNGVFIKNEHGKTQFKYKVQILRRDAKSPCNKPDNQSKHIDTSNAPFKSSKHRKSLQQREAEYAEARLRIFGSTTQVDDVDNDKIKGVDAKHNNNGCSHNQSLPDQMKPVLITSPVTVIIRPTDPDKLILDSKFTSS